MLETGRTWGKPAQCEFGGIHEGDVHTRDSIDRAFIVPVTKPEAKILLLHSAVLEPGAFNVQYGTPTEPSILDTPDRGFVAASTVPEVDKARLYLEELGYIYDPQLGEHLDANAYPLVSEEKQGM